MEQKTSANMSPYLVKPEVKPEVVWPSIPKDAKPTESQYAYFASKHMAARAAWSVSKKRTENKSFSILRSWYTGTHRHE